MTRAELDLERLAVNVPCLGRTPREDCRCDGCQAAAAIRLAAAHMERGELLHAHVKLGHAEVLCASNHVRDALEAVHAALLVQAAGSEPVPASGGCSTEGCPGTAAFLVHWPSDADERTLGRAERTRLHCARRATGAERIGRAIGWQVRVEPLAAPTSQPEGGAA